MDKAIIKGARQANLAEYLISVGVPLEKDGSRYRHKEHDSLTFTKNAYYWNSRQESGNAVDFVTRHMNMNFMEAVSALVPYQVNIGETKTSKFELSLCDDIDKVKVYLNKHRFVGYNIIDYLVENKRLFQEIKTNNAVFPMYDENNNLVGAELQGIIPEKRFKGIKAGSKYGYGFNVRFANGSANNGSFDYILFFECAVDLISFIDLKRNHEKKNLNQCILVSMAGLKPNILKHSLKAFRGNLKVVLCVDNDEAGKQFKQKIQEEKIPFITREPDTGFKDWNEQLQILKQGKKTIERLMNYGKIL